MTRKADPRVEFGRPTYGSLHEMLVDQARFLRGMPSLRRDAKRGLVTKAFRERLMLAVTSVNECRYCSWAHAKAALRAGIPEGQVDDLLLGVVADCPEEEGPALLYALHWAETDGHPDAETRNRMVEVYGPERAGAIERSLGTIRSGNMLGNTTDYLLFRLSRGHLGGVARVYQEENGQVSSAPTDE